MRLTDAGICMVFLLSHKSRPPHLETDTLNGTSCIGLQVCIAVTQAADQSFHASALYHQSYTGSLITHIQDDVGSFSCNWLADNAAEVLKDSLDALPANLQPVVFASG